ncbi:hypothetical protein ACFWZ2_28930 [Streptomyces sp. NPDC059002]|uniref:hypothetical protein n=1 Tax=Streptomyces sp. NPDC059002 TaxID=3346690 RepID=UPI0036C0368A
MALQVVKASGFETIAITHSPDKGDLGADHVVANGKRSPPSSAPTGSPSSPRHLVRPRAAE